jgi:hypothetical protein
MFVSRRECLRFFSSLPSFVDPWSWGGRPKTFFFQFIFSSIKKKGEGQRKFIHNKEF